MKKISVILPVYNNCQLLPIAISSILEQSYLNFELLILNDGSTEDVDSIVKKFKDKRIKYYSRENKGLGASLNELLSLSTS